MSKFLRRKKNSSKKRKSNRSNTRRSQRMGFEQLENKVLLAADVALTTPFPAAQIDLADPPVAVVIAEGTDEADRPRLPRGLPQEAGAAHGTLHVAPDLPRLPAAAA